MNATTMTRTAIALGLALALTGCTAGNEPTVTPTTDTAPVAEAPAETPVAEEAPVVEAPAPVAPVVGETVTAEQAAALPEGQSAYELADGTLVLVDAAQPLPAPVVADIKAEGEAGLVLGEDTGSKDIGTLRSLQRSASRETGKDVVVVGPAMGALGDSWTMQLVWSAAASQRIGPAKTSKDEQVAAAQAWIAAQENPAAYELIVLDA